MIYVFDDYSLVVVLFLTTIRRSPHYDKSQMSSNLIERSIHSTVCQIWTKSLVNNKYNLVANSIFLPFWGVRSMWGFRRKN